MDKKLPKFEGSDKQKNKKISLFENYPISSRIELNVPKLDEEKNAEKLPKKDLFGQIKNLFQSGSKIREVANNNSSTKNLQNILNRIEKVFKSKVSTTDTNNIKESNKYYSDTTIVKEIPAQFRDQDKPLYPQDRKNISIFNSYMGKNPSITNNNLSPNTSELISFIDNFKSNKTNNITSKKINLSLTNQKINPLKTKYVTNKNESKNYQSDSISTTSNDVLNTSSNLNTIQNSNSNSNDIKNINSDIKQIKSQIQNTTDNITTNSKNKYKQTYSNSLQQRTDLPPPADNIGTNSKNKYKQTYSSLLRERTDLPPSSVERQPYFSRQGGVNYMNEPLSSNKQYISIPSFMQGGGIDVKGSFKGSTVTLKAGERGRSEKIDISPKKDNVMSQSAQNIQDAAMEEKSNANNSQKEQQARDQAGDYAAANSTNTTFNTTNVLKKITTFEKVAIETYMVPNWRRVFA